MLHEHSIKTHSASCQYKMKSIKEFCSQFKEEAWKINRKWQWTKIPWVFMSVVFLDERKLAEVR